MESRCIAKKIERSKAVDKKLLKLKDNYEKVNAEGRP